MFGSWHALIICACKSQKNLGMTIVLMYYIGFFIAALQWKGEYIDVWTILILRMTLQENQIRTEDFVKAEMN